MNGTSASGTGTSDDMSLATVNEEASAERRVLDLGGGVGAVIRVRSEQTSGRLAVVEHPIQPGGLIEPHTHALEDEWSYVLSGTVGVQVGDEIRQLGAGDQIFKPRGIEHAVWNPAGEPALVLEAILPGGFEQFFEKASQVVAADGGFDEQELIRLAERYAVSMAFEKAPALAAELGLARRRDG